MQRGPVCLAESERVRFFIAGELGRVGERGGKNQSWGAAAAPLEKIGLGHF